MYLQFGHRRTRWHCSPRKCCAQGPWRTFRRGRPGWPWAEWQSRRWTPYLCQSRSGSPRLRCAHTADAGGVFRACSAVSPSKVQFLIFSSGTQRRVCVCVCVSLTRTATLTATSLLLLLFELLLVGEWIKVTACCWPWPAGRCGWATGSGVADVIYRWIVWV